MRLSVTELIEDVLISESGVEDPEDEIPYLADRIYTTLKDAGRLNG